VASEKITRLVLATGNPGKLRELKRLLAGTGIELVGLGDYPGIEMPEESGRTFLENARIKAEALGKVSRSWVLSDDSGLEVEALGGAPGVHSARYAGPGATDRENNLKLLAALQGIPPQQRAAAFVCVLVLRSPAGEEWSFTGRCRGRISETLSGSGGFGYDPVFLVSPDFSRTMAELSPEEKNRLSHRGAALRQLCDWLARR
jgi:XTP/dITP diphosphohydrolase